FQTQIFFLLSRYHQQRRTVHELVASGRNLFADYTFAKDALFAQINLKGDELDMYYKVHEALAEKIQKPDLLVYLQASTNTLMQRIATNSLNIIQNPEHLKLIENRIRQSLNLHPFQQSLPLTD